MKITKKTKFSDLLKEKPEAAKILFQMGLSCIGCPMAQKETIEQGALVHGMNPDKLVKELNKKLNKTK